MVVIKASASLTHAVTAFGESNSHSTSSEQVAEQQGSATAVCPALHACRLKPLGGPRGYGAGTNAAGRQSEKGVRLAQKM
jgi:hypothetical protein